MFNELPCGVIITDKSLCIEYINDWVVTKLCLDQSALPEHFEDILPPASKVFCQTYMLPMVIKDGFVNELFVNLKSQDSRDIAVFIHANTVHHAHKEYLQWVITPASQRAEFEKELIHQRRQAEDFARQADEARSLLQSILDGVRDVAILATSPAGDILFASKGAEILFKQSRVIIERSNLLDSLQLPCQSKRDTHDPSYASRLSVELTNFETMLCVDKSPDIPVEVQLRHLKVAYNKSELGCVVVLSDIAQKKIYQSLQDNFIANISHELRTPLTAIFGALTLLNADRKSNFSLQSRKLLDSTLKNTQRLDSLVKTILEFSNLRTDNVDVNFEQADLCALIQRAFEEQQQLVSKQIKMTACFPQQPILIETDVKLFHQVISHLLSNAIKFSPENNEVRAKISVFEKEVCIRIVDHGIGVSPDFEPLLFTAFRQQDGSSSRAFEGTGLGLYVCKQLVVKMGGSIGFERPEKGGSVFWFTCRRVSPQ